MRYSKKYALFSCLLIVLLGPATLRAAASANLPPNKALIDNKLEAYELAGNAATDGTLSIVDSSNGPGFIRALRVDCKKREPADYDLECELKLPSVALKNGDIIWAGVWARMLRTEDESGQGILAVVLEQSKQPFDKIITRRVSVGPQWQKLEIPARIHVDEAAGSLHLTLRLGGAAQTLEIAGVELIRFDDPASIDFNQLPQTRVTYGGREPDAEWRKAADDRIDKIRKAPLTVQVVDVAGHPVAGASIHVEMLQHAFPFGCVYNSAFLAGPNAQIPANQEYGRRFVELFNVGVDENGMKWPSWITPAKRELTMEALHWLKAQGVRVRGHCLVWPSWRRLPAELATLKNDSAALSQAVDNHIHDEVSALSGCVTEWDVINEPYVNNDLMKILGYGAMADWFKIAHAADPSPRLMLNETSVPTNPPSDPHYDALFEQVQAIQKAGAPIGGVGMQAHFGSNLTSISDLAKIYDRFATLGIPLEITELDIDVNDEQLQADYLGDFLTFTFSHPNISGIMMWGFVESHHWRPDAALWHADWKIKPAGQAWLDLVKKKWWTRANMTTAEDGTASVRGFLGDYLVTATIGNQAKTMHIALTSAGDTAKFVVR